MNQATQRNNERDTECLLLQNVRFEKRMERLQDLQRELFLEQQNRKKEEFVSPAVRLGNFWYFSRNFVGKPYDVQYRLPVIADDDWNPPDVTAVANQSDVKGEEVVFDANAEIGSSKYFHLQDLSISNDGELLLYSTDTKGNERYTVHLRRITQSKPLSDVIPDTGGACLSPDGQWVFYLVLDNQMRPFAVKRHHIGSSIQEDVEVFRENDEKFRVTVTISNDNQYIVITSASPTSKEVLILPAANPTGEFISFIKRQSNIKYSVQFGFFEAEEDEEDDIPIAVIRHNGRTPNFEVDIIDMRLHEPPFYVGEGTCIAMGESCPVADTEIERKDSKSVLTGKRQRTLPNPRIFQQVRGLNIFSVCVRRNFISLSYRSDGLPRIAFVDKVSAKESTESNRPLDFNEVKPLTNNRVDSVGDSKIYSIVSSGNLSYDSPNMRYSIFSYTSPTEIREVNPLTGDDNFVGGYAGFEDFDSSLYAEQRIWLPSRDGEKIPVSLIWKKELPQNIYRERPLHSAVTSLPQNRPMYITGYGAYGVSTDPDFSMERLSLLDRGILYAVVHVRGGGELGYAWHEQGRKLHKRTSFEDFIDSTQALQDAGCAKPERTVAYGNSAGGLLVASAVSMAPDCYAGVIADSPFVDPLTTLLNPSSPLTVAEWDEWGNPLESQKVFEYIRSYSPCENLPSHGKQEGKVSGESVQEWRFPSVLAIAAKQDARVSYRESLKLSLIHI